MPLKVAVVGAGIVGLATTSELMRAGADVRCYEKLGPATAQSKGSTRIFRQAHGDTRLVELAVRAREGWRQWEDRFRRKLVGHEGLIVTGEEIVPLWKDAMSRASAPCQLLTESECRERLPIASFPAAPALFDPEGGATRIRRTVDLLCRDIGKRVQICEVQAIESHGDCCTVHSNDGTWECDEVIIAAGVDTQALASTVGLTLPLTVYLHSRFTFEIRGAYLDTPLSCWIDDSGIIGPGWYEYGQPVGTSGRYALGVSWEGQQCTLDVGADTVSEESRQITIEYVRRALPGLEPEPVDEIRCTYSELPFSDYGDGFLALRNDRITAFYGNNLFKFAPLLGTSLKMTAMTGEIAPELALFSI